MTRDETPREATEHPYRSNSYVEPVSHRGHGYSGCVVHVGAPTRLRFCRCGVVIDEAYHEVRTQPLYDGVTQ